MTDERGDSRELVDVFQLSAAQFKRLAALVRRRQQDFSTKTAEDVVQTALAELTRIQEKDGPVSMGLVATVLTRRAIDEFRRGRARGEPLDMDKHDVAESTGNRLDAERAVDALDALSIVAATIEQWCEEGVLGALLFREKYFWGWLRETSCKAHDVSPSTYKARITGVRLRLAKCIGSHLTMVVSITHEARS